MWKILFVVFFLHDWQVNKPVYSRSVKKQFTKRSPDKIISSKSSNNTSNGFNPVKKGVNLIRLRRKWAFNRNLITTATGWNQHSLLDKSRSVWNYFRVMLSGERVSGLFMPGGFLWMALWMGQKLNGLSDIAEENFKEKPPLNPNCTLETICHGHDNTQKRIYDDGGC